MTAQIQKESDMMKMNKTVLHAGGVVLSHKQR